MHTSRDYPRCSRDQARRMIPGWESVSSYKYTESKRLVSFEQEAKTSMEDPVRARRM